MSNAYSAALNYLAARSRTVKETRDYLRRKGYSASAIEEAIGRLQHSGLLDDRRTAQQWVDYCLACKPRGRERLRHDLLKRGIDRGIVSAVLESVDDDCEYALALQLLASRPVSSWSRAKLFRFLLYRGFSFSVIERICLANENLTED